MTGSAAARHVPRGHASGRASGRTLSVATVPAILPAILLATLVAALAAPAHAQAVLGRTVAGSTGAPLGGVFVTLTDDAGEQAAGLLSRPDGRFMIRAPAGRYTLAAELIGYGSVTRSVELTAEATTQVTLRLPLEAVALEGIVARASGTQRCRLDPTEGDALSRLWSEARKGLRIADWAQETGWLRANGYTYERVLEPAELEVLAETVRPARWLERAAFAAADPEVLQAEGFLVEEGDGYIYRGADARTFLSDAFQATHCFRLREARAEGLVGMAFEPTPGRRVPDIEGVLWLDVESARLHSLEYSYTEYPVNFPLPRSRFGGFTRFRHLPGGGVAVERWWIRMPALRHFAEGSALRSVRRCGVHACDDPATLRELARAGLAIREAGGAVLSFRLADGTTLPAGDEAAIVGVVVDSTASDSTAPLAGAEVWIQGTEHRAVTDGRGRFRIDPIPEGTYRLRFHHPRLAEVGIQRPEPVLARARTGEVVTTTLATPSPATLATLRCRAPPDSSAVEPAARADAAGVGRAEGGDARAVVYGEVRDAATGARIGGARVRLLASREGAPGVVAETETDPSGRYTFCRAPPTAARVSADFLGEGERALALPAGEDGPARVDLELVLSPASRLSGRVVTADGAEPVGGAGVRIRETGQRAVTDGRGQFAFDSVPAGALTLETDHIAYRPTEAAVAVRGGERVRVELRVDDQVFQLDPLVVTARSRPLLMDERMAGFYIRQARGMGTFIDRDDLASRPTARVTDVLREVQGIRVAGTGGTGRVIQSTRNPLARVSGCSPVVYVNGMRVSPHRVDPSVPDAARLNRESMLEAVRIIDAIPTDEIAGIEVYPGPSTVPGEFAGLDTDCGVIAIWTATRDRSPR